MARSFSSATVLGWLTEEVRLTKTRNGAFLVRNRACAARYRRKWDPEKKEFLDTGVFEDDFVRDSLFMPFVLWGERSTGRFVETVSQGDWVQLHGYLQSSFWEDRRGQRRSRVDLVAERWGLIMHRPEYLKELEKDRKVGGVDPADAKEVKIQGSRLAAERALEASMNAAPGLGPVPFGD